MNNDCLLQVEVPAPWFDNPNDGIRHRQFWSNLCVAIANVGINTNFINIPSSADKAPRLAPDCGLLLSYHSVGYADRVWRMKESYIPPYYSFDRTGHSGWSEFCNDFGEIRKKIESFSIERARDLISKLRLDFKHNNLSKYNQNDDALSIEDGFIFFPTQVPSDAVAEFSRFNTVDVIKKLSELARCNRVNVLIKRHPLCDDERISELINNESENNIFLHTTNASIHKIIPRASAVVVANSGVGFEALVHGRQVFTFGRSEYESATIQLNNLPDLAMAFRKIDETDAVYRDKLIGYFLLEHCVDGSNVAIIEKKLRALVQISDLKTPDECYRRQIRDVLNSFASVEIQRRLNLQIEGKFDEFQITIRKNQELLANSEMDKISTTETFNNIISELNLEISGLNAEINKISNHNLTLASRCEALDFELHRIRMSTSWRVTKPARILVGFLNRLRA